MSWFRHRLMMTVLSVSKYIKFADSKVGAILISKFGDGKGITTEEAATITDFTNLFKDNTEVTKFPESINFTGIVNIKRAFNSATNLEVGDMYLPNVIEQSGIEFSFYKVKGVGNVSLPNLELSSGAGCFRESGVKSVHFGKIKLLGDNAFREATQLHTVTGLENCTTMQGNCFNGCTSLVIDAATLNPNCSFDNSCFKDTQLFGHLIVNNNTGGGAFIRTKINSVYSNDPNSSYKEATFAYCTELHTAEFGPKTQNISIRTFDGCTNLNSVTFPQDNSILTIGRGSFANTGLVNIDMSKCTKVTRIGEDNWNQQGVFENCQQLTKLVLPPNITEIGSNLCYKATQLAGTTLTIPNSVTTLQTRAFYGCKAYLDVELPNLTSLKNSAFAYSNIRRLVIHKSYGIEYFNSEICQDCPELTLIDLPDTIISMGKNCIAKVPKLESIIIRAINPPALDGYAFSQFASFTVIYVPDESLDKYKTASGWVAHVARIKPLSEYKP